MTDWVHQLWIAESHVRYVLLVQHVCAHVAHLGVYEVEEGWQGVCEAEAALEA